METETSSFEEHWLAFHSYTDEQLLNCKQTFERSQPHLHDYLLTLQLNDAPKAILFFVSLALWQYAMNRSRALPPVSEAHILERERENALHFRPLEHSDEFAQSLRQLLQDYPQRSLFEYVGQLMATRNLGREDLSITADQRGWMILYLKVVIDCLYLYEGE